MTMLTIKRVAVAGLLALVPGSALGQTGGSANGVIELGFRGFTDRPTAAESGAFLMYRDVPRGLFMQQAGLLWTSFDQRTFVHVQGRELGEQDQFASLNLSKPGSYRLEVSWGQLPHTFSTTARYAGQETERGVYTLPTPRQDTFALKKLTIGDPIATRWDPLRLAAGLTANKRDIDFNVEYQRVAKSGNRPIGTPFYMTNYREVPEPIEQTTHALKLTQSIKRDRYHMQLGYDLSVFQNELESMIVDNPLVATDAVNSPARARVSLAPDNTAHTFSWLGAATLPSKTRVNVTANYSMRSQNQALLPHTINTAISTANLDAVPSDLAGDVRTTMINASITTRALQDVSVTARYRWFDFADQTPDLHLNGRVVTDRSLSTTPVERHRYPFSKQNGGLDLSWRPDPSANLQAGYGWERWQRDAHVRNVARSDENTLRGAATYLPTETIRLRASAVHARRRADEYLQVNDIQNPLLRRFDQADRDRTRLELSTEFTPIETFSITTTLGRGKDAYLDVAAGVTVEQTWNVGMDASWSPLANLSFTGGYMGESFKNQLRSRYRTPTQLANPTYDWVANSNDRITTWYIGGETSIRSFDLGVNAQRSSARLFPRAYNPFPPSGGSASDNTSATAVSWPDIWQDIMPITAYVRYAPRPRWTVGLGWTYENYKNRDWRTDWQTAVDGNHLILGNDLLDYTASYLSATITYRPQLKRATATM